MSRLFFIPPKAPLVKMNCAEKIELCRIRAKIIMSTERKYLPIFIPIFHVENSCGKTCGQCGKLKVINRYSGFLHFHSPGATSHFLTLFVTTSYHHNRMLRHRHYGNIICLTFPKKLAFTANCPVFAVRLPDPRQKICEKLPNRQRVSFPPRWRQ